MDFKTEKKGYNKSEVGEYILRLVKNYEQAAARRDEEMESLKARLEESEKKNRAYRDKENLVCKAITSAVSKADEIERLARLKYTREMQQLKAFHDKWLSYYDKILKKYPLDSELIRVGKFNEEMSRILDKARARSAAQEKKDSFAQTMPKETRIGYTVIDSSEKESKDDDLGGLLADGFDPVDRIRTYLAKERAKNAAEDREKNAEKSTVTTVEKPVRNYADRSPSGFSFEEALHPEGDLEDIMRDLGLLLD